MDNSKVSGDDIHLDKTLCSHHNTSGSTRSALDSEIAQLKEQQNQMKYELKKKVDAFEVQEKFYNDEIEYWKKEFKTLKSNLEHQSNEFDKEKIQLKNAHVWDISDFSEKIESLKLENKKLKKELHDNKNRTIQDIIDIDKFHELENTISDLKDKLCNSNIEIKLLEQRCTDLEEKNLHLINENHEYQETLDLKRQEVKESNCIIMELQDELSMVRKELNDVQNQPRDINARGNSLFAEVYDSRNRIKEQYITLAAKYNRLLKDKESIAGEVGILRSEISTMRGIFEKDMKNFQPGNLFEISGDSDSMSAMRSLVNSYKEEINRLKTEEPPAERDYRYYEAVIQRQKKDIDKLRGILSDHSLTHAMKARKFSEMGCEIACLKSKVSEVESDKRFLELKCRELENKILDLQEEIKLSNPEQNKENDKTDGKKKNDKNLKEHELKPVHQKSSKIKDISQKTLAEIYGTDKARIISKEEIEAIMNKQTFKNPACKNESEENKTQEIEKDSAEATESIQESVILREHNPSQLNANEDHEMKRGVRFANDTKKDDGGKQRPRGKNRYVYDPETKVMKKVN